MVLQLHYIVVKAILVNLLHTMYKNCDWTQNLKKKKLWGTILKHHKSILFYRQESFGKKQYLSESSSKNTKTLFVIQNLLYWVYSLNILNKNRKKPILYLYVCYIVYRTNMMYVLYSWIKTLNCWINKPNHHCFDIFT